MSLPWSMLVRPISTWRHLAQHHHSQAWWAVLLAQWVLLGFAQVAALQPSFELATYSGLSINQLPPTWFAVIWQLVLFAVGIASANLICAAVIFGVCKLVAIRCTYAKAYILTSYSLLPAVLGSALGTVVFAITQPLTRQASHAIALLSRPFALGLASFPPLAEEPLSLGWVLASYLDVFSIWSLALFLIGSVLLLKLSVRQASWLGVGVVLSLVAGLTVWWRVLQIAAMR